ncbi:hypothetical protein [Paenibacillus beijingensis]|uniref:Spore coat protein n=1 Tax=Paenibacillus beijingensis TaxID=1126833 RepID=A0A0D5NHK5_9BACL|nr:hypothetical protein [Paenibacillus beijingensis]AJY74864.1 hypothetical protein VN24_10020 [Paenibacillus beijingensis]
MRKMAVWLAKTVAAALIVSFLSIWTTGYIVNSYVETVLKQFNIPLQTQPFALSGVWGKLWGADSADGGQIAGEKTGSGAAEGSADSGTDRAGSNSAGKGSGGTGSGGDGSGSAAGESGGPEGGTGDEPLAVDAFGQDGEEPVTGSGSGPKAYGGAAGESGSDSPAPGGDDRAAGSGAGAAEGGNLPPTASISTEQLNEAKQQMSAADKETLFTLLMTKLPQDAWQTISGYMENGLTQEELSSTEQILAQYLSREEYEKMKDILKKY